MLIWNTFQVRGDQWPWMGQRKEHHLQMRMKRSLNEHSLDHCFLCLGDHCAQSKGLISRTKKVNCNTLTAEIWVHYPLQNPLPSHASSESHSEWLKYSVLWILAYMGISLYILGHNYNWGAETRSMARWRRLCKVSEIALPADESE